MHKHKQEAGFNCKLPQCSEINITAFLHERLRISFPHPDPHQDGHVQPRGRRLQLESAVGLKSHSKTKAGRPVLGPAYSPARPLALPMPLLSLGPIAIGVVAIIRAVLLDTLR